MKSTIATIACIAALFLAGCGQKSNDQEGHDHEHAGEPVGTEGNTALLDEVDKIHNEAMSKMDVSYRLKEELKNKIANTPDMAEEMKKEIEARIIQLDSANDRMMVWMRQFNPLPDSLGEEKAREYLENEMEKIKKIREDMDGAIEKAEAQKQ